LKKRNAIFWPFRYAVHKTSPELGNLNFSWEPRFRWVAQSLLSEGFNVFRHKDFICDLGDNVKTYEPPFKDYLDLIIYNHADASEIEGNILDAERTWFFKPTVPDANQTTLDDLGYGSYSSITYEKPNFENSESHKVNCFFDHKVKSWINSNSNKWGNPFSSTEIPHDDFILIIGQCSGDSVLNRQDFGSYLSKLRVIINHLLRSSDKDIVVKLHPHMNGSNWKQGDPDVKQNFQSELSSLSNRLSVYSDKSSIHSFLPKCSAVVVGNSGSGFEAMMHDKPIISFCMPEYHWVTYDLRKVCDIRRALQTQDWFDPEKSRKFLYWYMEEYCFFDQRSSNLRVKQLLESKPRKYPWHRNKNI